MTPDLRLLPYWVRPTHLFVALFACRSCARRFPNTVPILSLVFGPHPLQRTRVQHRRTLFNRHARNNLLPIATRRPGYPVPVPHLVHFVLRINKYYHRVGLWLWLSRVVDSRTLRPLERNISLTPSRSKRTLTTTQLVSTNSYQINCWWIFSNHYPKNHNPNAFDVLGG